MISEEKMQIVINNYFKSECSVDTSIRQAFEKGFRIGVKKGLSAQPERETGKWIDLDSDAVKYDDIMCSNCKQRFTVDAYRWCDIGFTVDDLKFCPNCGAKMDG